MKNLEVQELFKTCDPLDVRLSEVAMVSAIISDNFLDQIYKLTGEGYINTVYTIGKVAMEFTEKFLDYQWENLLDDELPSPFPTSIDCWDDAVCYYAFTELNKLGINVQSINQ